MPKRDYDRNRPSARKRGYTKAWENAAKEFLDANPMCAQCKREGRATPAKLVDHIIPHNGRQSLMWDKRNNWQSLCQECHNRKTAQERTGNKSIKGFDESGMPTSPDHPWNKMEDTQPERWSAINDEAEWTPKPPDDEDK